jgi:hypothetical protein
MKLPICQCLVYLKISSYEPKYICVGDAFSCRWALVLFRYQEPYFRAPQRETNTHMASVVFNAISCLVILFVAYLMWFRPEAGALECGIVVFILLLFILALSWISVMFGLVQKRRKGHLHSVISCCLCTSLAPLLHQPNPCQDFVLKCNWGGLRMDGFERKGKRGKSR